MSRGIPVAGDIVAMFFRYVLADIEVRADMRALIQMARNR